MNLFWIILIIIFSIPISLAFASVEGEIDFILKKANKFLKEKKFEEAIAVIDEALELDPNNLGALEKKGDALFKLGNNDEALLNYEKILQISPNHVVRSGKPLFEKVLEINPNHVFAMNKKGENLLKQDSLDEAILYFDKVLEINPNHADSLSNKGVTLEILGSSEEAKQYFDKALEIDPNQVTALGNKGDAFAKLGNNKEALFYYDKVLSINPRYFDISGTPYYDKTLEIDPNHVIALYTKGLGLSFFDNLLEHSISYFDRVLEIEPKHTGALANKGASLVRLGNSQEGLLYFDKALKTDPENLDILSKKGDALVKLDNFEEGISYFDKVLEQDPNNVDALYKKGDAFRDQQNHTKAFSYFYKVLEIEPNHNLARNKIIITNTFRTIPVDGYMEAIIRDSQDNLVSHLRIPHIGILNHEIAFDMVEDWPVTKIVSRNGTDYEMHQFERIKNVGYRGGVWGGASHYGLHPPFGTNIWLVYANYWMYLPERGDQITFVYTIFLPVE